MSQDYVTAMKAFSDTMKSCVSISAAALVFPITVLKATSSSGAVSPNVFLVIAWISLGFSILFGLLYQVEAARRIAAALNISTSDTGQLGQPEFYFNATLAGLLLGLPFLVYALTVAV